jgi:hypothetical protein
MALFDFGLSTVCLCSFEPLHQPATSLGSQKPRKRKSTKDYVRIYQRKMQNKPNSPNVQMNLTFFIAMYYAIFASLTKVKNKPNQTQLSPKTQFFQRPKMLYFQSKIPVFARLRSFTFVFDDFLAEFNTLKGDGIISLIYAS